MILRLFKSNAPIINFIFVLVGVLLWLNALMQPFTYPYFNGEDKNLLYSFLGRITMSLPLLQVLLSLVFILFLSFLIQQIKISFALIKTRTKLPAVVFIIMAGGLTGMHTLHPVYFAAIFLLLAMYSLFSVFNNHEPATHFFNAGLFLCLGCLFYLNLVVLLLAFLFSISILRKEPSLKEYFILLLGFFVPLLFAFTYVFFTDKLNDILIIYRDSFITPVNHFKGNYALLGFALVLALLTFIGSIKMIQQYDSSKVSTRKYFMVLFQIFIFTILSFILVPGTSQEILIIAIIPVSLLLANLFVSVNSVFWSELLFILLILAAVFMQFSRYFPINV